ncbi:unnamed protein product, partial [Heterosigma akashiwo]
MVAMGDLCFRFPNELEPWTSRVYARLRDPAPAVRAQALLVLTHLVLNDMVKVKGQVSEIALCLRDEEERLRRMARHFFQELAQRANNPVYNLLPDVLGTLSARKDVDNETFEYILSYLLKFIKKDKQAESLVEKLCQRFAATHDLDQKRDFAYCLSQLHLNERCLHKLVALLKLYKDFLHDDRVYQHFREVAKKAKKFSKPELREAVTEWERVLQRHHAGADDDD